MRPAAPLRTGTNEDGEAAEGWRRSPFYHLLQTGGWAQQRILADSALFQVRGIAYDPWNAAHIALRLQDEGAAMVEFRQGFRSMAALTRELEKLIVSKTARMAATR